MHYVNLMVGDMKFVDSSIGIGSRFELSNDGSKIVGAALQARLSPSDQQKYKKIAECGMVCLCAGDVVITGEG